jgi:phytoene dehydrogenase-like protein
METGQSRRTTLIQLGSLCGGVALAPGLGALAAPAPAYAVPDWTGDSFTPMHAIRDQGGPGKIPAPTRKVDLAIIGGGITGLAVASLLRDRDLVVLEREATMGGNAKSGNWKGIDYALGSAYLVDKEEPYGPFYEEIGVNPTRIPEPADRVLAGGPEMADALLGSLRKPFTRLRDHMTRLLESPDFPKTNIRLASPAALALDGVSFLDYLRKLGVAPDLLPLIDAYCHSALGGGIETVSAYAGVNFYSEIATPIYAFPGGNSALVRAMTARIDKAGGGRMITNASVFAVEPDAGGGALVGYVHGPSGEARAIAARKVVMATPFFFVPRVVRGLDPATEATLRAMSHGSYLVANCCFSGRTLPGPYDSWTPTNPAFTDFVSATAVVPGKVRPKDRDVLTVYAPFRDPVAGRAGLLGGDKDAYAAQVVEGLRRFAPDVFRASRLEEVRLTRYGHQILTSRVGLVTALRGLNRQVGNVILAHSDGQGMSAVESAVVEAIRAVEALKT